jgi:hypothetical protein
VQTISNTLYTKKRLAKGVARPLLQKYWVPIVTIFLGVFPLAVLSYLTNSFWIHSTYSRPFLRSISIVLGDSAFIPIFNYYFHRLLLINNNFVRRRKVLLFFVFLIILGINSCIVYSIHKAWTADQYTGFMDLTIGKLSMAGWWHLCFASLQTSLIIFFLIIWFVFSKYNKAAFNIGLSGWRVLTVYFVFGIFDFLIKIQTASEKLSISYLQLGWPRIAGFLIAIIILIFASRYLSNFLSNLEIKFQKDIKYAVLEKDIRDMDIGDIGKELGIITERNIED